ncbi:hypothetical protein [Bacteriovorax sp. DB6_IX]|uniref:hypothetical protein n=1 Tax=Bacteriovorax sp. DB6_IX TaxID=1353530 RepID=UPI000389F3A7|nr:hypothetical protein [Bacteriovorax sp. DB6_IX]EQC51428.1 hypothetical protein M901_3008 [Bacteriovorax sp. DB6_IX]
MTDIRIHRPHITNQNVQKPKKFEDSSKYIPEQIKEVAQSYEKEFAKMMIQEMQKSVSKYSKDSSANFYQSLMTDEQAQSMTKNNEGVGTSKNDSRSNLSGTLRNQANYDYQYEKASSKEACNWNARSP